MGLEVNEIDTVAYPAWWVTSHVVRIRDAEANIVFEGDTADVEFLPQGVSFPYSMYPWSNVRVVQGVS
jgi:hypothetical protein